MEQSRAAQWQERAEALGSHAQRPSKPFPAEETAAWVRCASALRRGAVDELQAIIDQEGYLPDGGGKDAPSLLWLAATGDRAVGFLAVCKAAVARAMREKAATGYAVSVGEVLRDKAYVSAYDMQERRFERPTEYGQVGFYPIASILTADSPAALAALLSEPEWYEALVALEPPPLALDPNMSGKEKIEAVKRSGCAESSLLFEAIRAGAGGCAALLLGIPEFSRDLITDKTPSLGYLEYPRRDPQQVFQEESRVEFSLFERLLCEARSEQGSYSQRERAQSRMMMAVDAAIERTPPDAIEPQEGTGMLWPEMVASRAVLYTEESRADFASRLKRMSDLGYRIDWPVMGDLFEKARDAHWKEWCELQGAAKAPAAPRPKTASL